MKNFTLLSLGLLMHGFGFSQNLEWAKSFSANGHGQGRAIHTDDAGNIYMTGWFEETADFDPGHGEVLKTAIGCTDIFIAKLTPEGDLDWVHTFGDAGCDYGNDLKVDAHGDVYVTGAYVGGIDFDPGSGNMFKQSGGIEIFVLKLKSNGDFGWVQKFDGCGVNLGHSIQIDGFGNVLVTGSFQGKTDFDPGPGELMKTSNVSGDIFVLKLTPQGGLNWVQTFGAREPDGGHEIHTDDFGNVYVTGIFNGEVDFSLGSEAIIKSSKGNLDFFILKLTPEGNLAWIHTLGGGAHDYGESIHVDGLGNVYLTGSFLGTIDFDPGPGTWLSTSKAHNDIFVLKLTTEGVFAWVKTFEGTGSDGGRSIQTDAFGNAYVTGWFEGTIDCDPGFGQVFRTSNGSRDIFIARLTPEGELDWFHVPGGEYSDAGMHIHVDRFRNVYVTGWFSDEFNFGLEDKEAVLAAIEGWNIFVLKLSQPDDDTPKPSILKIYPNPTSGWFTVEGDLDEVRVWEVLGRELMREPFTGAIMEFDLSNYPSATYFIELRKGNVSDIRKLVVTQ